MTHIQIVPFVSAIANSQRWIGSPAVAISGTNLQSRRELLISNVAGMTLFIGSTGVTMINGTPVAVGDQVSIPMAGSPQTTTLLYGVGSGTGSCDIRMMEVGG